MKIRDEESEMMNTKTGTLDVPPWEDIDALVAANPDYDYEDFHEEEIEQEEIPAETEEQWVERMRAEVSLEEEIEQDAIPFTDVPCMAAPEPVRTWKAEDCKNGKSVKVTFSRGVVYIPKGLWYARGPAGAVEQLGKTCQDGLKPILRDLYREIRG